MEATSTSAAVQPVASWNFEDAAGAQLTDNSGNGNHGTIHGATWVEIDGGHALRFDGVDDYVDCGNGKGLDLQAPLSLEVWANPATASADEPGIAGKFFESYLVTVYRGAAHFYISSGGNGVRGSIKTNAWSHIVGVFDGKKLRIYVNGELINEQTTKYPEARPGKNFTIGAVFGDPDNPDKFLRPSRFFPGMIDNVRLYDRALSAENVIRAFNEGAAIKGREPFDTSRFDKLGLNAFAYARQQEIQVTFDYRWIQPLPAGTQVEVRIIEPSSATALKSASAEANSPDYKGKLIIDAADLAPGLYVVHTRAGDAEAETSIQWPPPTPEPAAPDAFVAAPLPAAIVPPAYELDVAATGGMTVAIGDESFRIASAFSYPDGGENTLAAAKGAQAEPDWQSTVRATGDDTFELLASGAFYSLQRQIRKTPTRIEVEDTFTNTSDDVLGIMLSNYIDVYATDAWPILHSNPTVFAARSGIGIGIIALDDIYFLHSRNRFYKSRVELMDDHFGLAAKASYTVRWAIYPTATENYFDFINQVRHDEKINGRCEGGLTLSTGWITLSEEEVRIKNLTYLSQCYLTRVTADPVVSIEGWEFREYPVVCERIKQTITATREKYPQMQAGFHVAHSLFTTNNPERFADSKAIDVNGNQIMYGPNNMDYYGKYFSKELVEDNWRWWIFYPSATNSFGKYMLDAADYMINEMNANF
ncbi:MAG: LamG domain-containing protein, partial [Lentisphaeria bacterium]|nr:LamG domain-containing protein [Lentisphaeria bacterium]